MNSQEYWRQRELENIAKDYITDEQMLSEINQIYESQLRSITTEIESFYQRYAGASGLTMAEAMKAIDEFDVKAFESTAARMVKERDFSDKANKQLKIYNAKMRINRLELLKAKINTYLVMAGDDAVKTITDYAKNQLMEEYRRQAGILGESVDADVWKKVDQIVNASYKGARFSTRIWRYISQLRTSIGKLLQDYIVSGKGSIELARGLRKAFDVTKYQSENLARTEIRRMQTAVQVDFMKEHSITQYKFIAEPTACAKCKPLNGKVFELSKLQIGLNASPIHNMCRCSVTPYIDREEFEFDLERRGL